MEGKDATHWTCPGCKTAAATPFCPTCGESRPRERDLTLRAFLVEAFHTVTDVDGRLLRTFRTLVTRPGALTAAYRDGRRKGFLGPLQVFLIANVVFFALEAMSRDHVFSTTLASHVTTQDWRVLAQSLLNERLRVLDVAYDDYAMRFDLAAARNAKTFVVLMAVPFMLLLPLLHPGKARGIVVRAAFSLHLYAFLLLLFSAALLFADVQSALGGDGLRSPRIDLWLTLLLLGGCIAYLFTALGRVYPGPHWARAVRAVALSFVVGAIMLGYRLLTFLITLYTTR